MQSLALMLVVGSGLIHATWNLFTKRSVDKRAFLWLCHGFAVVVFLPMSILAMTASQRPIGWVSFAFLLGSALIHGTYIVMLGKTYTIGELSQVYPVMRGTSPLLVPLLGVLVLSEHLSLRGWLGVLFIVLGIFAIGGFEFHRLMRAPSQSVVLAFVVGLLITCYTLFDKVALHHIPPLALIEASNIGNLVLLSFGVRPAQGLRSEWRINWKTILLGSVMAPGGYTLFLVALRMAPVAQIAPIREIGTVFGTLLGALVLRESQGRKRLAASGAIVLGVFLLAG